MPNICGLHLLSVHQFLLFMKLYWWMQTKQLMRTKQFSCYSRIKLLHMIIVIGKFIRLDLPDKYDNSNQTILIMLCWFRIIDVFSIYKSNISNLSLVYDTNIIDSRDIYCVGKKRLVRRERSQYQAPESRCTKCTIFVIRYLVKNAMEKEVREPLRQSDKPTRLPIKIHVHSLINVGEIKSKNTHTQKQTLSKEKAWYHYDMAYGRRVSYSSP